MKADVKIGDVFGTWVVIDNQNLPIYPNSTKTTRYAKGILVRCPHGKEVRRNINALIRGDTSGCVICSHEKKFKGIGDLSSSYLSSIKIGAEKRNLIYSVSIEYLWDLFLKQDKKCALSGIPITLDPKYSTSLRKGKKINNTNSIS